ncbi:hypothetical protein, partial [Halolamina salina]
MGAKRLWKGGVVVFGVSTAEFGVSTANRTAEFGDLTANTTAEWARPLATAPHSPQASPADSFPHVRS